MAQRKISELKHIPLSSTPTPGATDVLHTLQTRVVRSSRYYDNISYVRLTWVDFANNPRCRIIPWVSFKKLLKKTPPAVQLHKITFGYVGGRAAPGFTPVGKWLLEIDIASLRLCPYEKGLATVFGWFREVEPTIGQRIAAPFCPRYILHRVLQYAKEVAGIEVLVGFETEYILLTSTNPITPINEHGWCDTLSTPSGSKEAIVNREIADNIQEADIEVDMYHAEAALGQYEIVTGPLTPLEACDALVVTRDIISNTASKHGLRATLSPRVFANDLGSASHAHISLQRTTADPPAPSASHPNLNHFEACFLSSLLSHLPSIQAFTLPLPASYFRIADFIWSGGTWVCWGTENKETPVRLVDGHLEGNGRRFEVKCIDGLSNPYLALASIIAAGAHGIVTNQMLQMQDLNHTSAASLSDAERRQYGIHAHMSHSIVEARAHLKLDEVLNELMGEEFVDAYIRVNQTLSGWIEEETGTNREQNEEIIRRRYVEHY